MATIGSSISLNLYNKIGNISEGYYADFNIINLTSTIEIEQRVKNAENFWEKFFPTIIMGDDRAIEHTWVSGEEIII